MRQFTKIIFIILLIILIGGIAKLNAQEFGNNVKQEGKVTLQTEQQGFKPDVRVSIGTSFSTFGPGFNTFGTYIAPEISFPVYQKFSMQVGLGYSSLFFGQSGESMFGTNPSQYGSLYVSGTYQINEKLTIRGTGYKTFLLNPAPQEETVNPGAMDFSNQGLILDIDYKVSEHFRINASFEYRKQNYPAYYYGNPQNGFGTPNNFNPGFGGFGGFNPGF